MSLFDPSPKLRWLFCWTHPDDELALACWIRRLTHAGADVFLSWTHSTQEREQEARSAAETLGVPQDRLFFHGSADGKVIDDIPRLLSRFEVMIGDCKPDRVVCAAFEQGHLDHDATNLVVNAAFDGPVFETPLYHTYAQPIPVVNKFACPDGQEVYPLSEEEASFKRRLANQYPSQHIRDLLIWYGIWARLRFEPFSIDTRELLRIQTYRDFLTPNLPPRLTLRVLKTGLWRRWHEAIRGLDLSRRVKPQP